jgi:hypothetical protein
LNDYGLIRTWRIISAGGSFFAYEEAAPFLLRKRRIDDIHKIMKTSDQKPIS